MERDIDALAALEALNTGMSFFGVLVHSEVLLAYI